MWVPCVDAVDLRIEKMIIHKDHIFGLFKKRKVKISKIYDIRLNAVGLIIMDTTLHPQ